MHTKQRPEYILPASEIQFRDGPGGYIIASNLKEDLHGSGKTEAEAFRNLQAAYRIRMGAKVKEPPCRTCGNTRELHENGIWMDCPDCRD